MEEDKPAVSSFAQWRQQETRGESQATKENEDDTTLGEAFNEGEREAATAQGAGEIEYTSDERPSIADAAPEDAQLTDSPDSDEILSPEQDPSNLEASATPETELDADERPAPLESQADSPAAVEPRTIDEEADEEPKSTASQPAPPPGQFGGSVPPKHLVHVDVNATEGERRAESRP